MPFTFSWTLLPDPATPPAPGLVSSGVGVVVPRQARRGLLRPFQDDGSGRLATATGDALLESQLGQLLGNRRGPAWNRALVADLDPLRNLRNTQALADFAAIRIRDAIRRWLPRLVLRSVAPSQPDRVTVNLLVTCQRIEELGVKPPRLIQATTSIRINQ